MATRISELEGDIFLRDDSDTPEPREENECAGCGENYENTKKTDDWVRCVVQKQMSVIIGAKISSKICITELTFSFKIFWRGSSVLEFLGRMCSITIIPKNHN